MAERGRDQRSEIEQALQARVLEERRQSQRCEHEFVELIASMERGRDQQDQLEREVKQRLTDASTRSERREQQLLEEIAVAHRQRGEVTSSHAAGLAAGAIPPPPSPLPTTTHPDYQHFVVASPGGVAGSSVGPAAVAHTEQHFIGDLPLEPSPITSARSLTSPPLAREPSSIMEMMHEMRQDMQ